MTKEARIFTAVIDCQQDKTNVRSSTLLSFLKKNLNMKSDLVYGLLVFSNDYLQSSGFGEN